MIDWGSQVFGIDVSHHQGAVDWSAVAADQGGRWRFCWAKATEGATWKDPRRTANLKGARAAGLLVGAYHYARPDNNGPAAEAANLLQVLDEVGELSLPAVLDLEHQSPAPGMGPSELRGWVEDWRAIVAGATGVNPVLYTGANYLAQFAGSKKPGWSPPAMMLWQPRYPKGNASTPPELLTKPVPVPGLPLAVWQYTSSGAVAGIPGKKVDLNVTDEQTLARLSMSGAGELAVALAAAAIAKGAV